MWWKYDYSNLPKACRAFGWYVLWLLIVLSLYRSGLLMFPKKDHYFFMLGRQLFDNDLSWFLNTLSYNRTRILYPGDYFAFRPLLMAILGIEDILFRHNLLALGIIGCGLFSFTATSLFMLTRRLAGFLPALGLTLVWTANLAGSEILLWQHITAYVLAPGLLSAAVLLLTDERLDSIRLWGAGLLLLGACLAHEISVITCIAMSFVAYFVMNRQVAGRRQAASAFLVPALFALALNAIDFFLLHRPPSITGPADTLNISNAAVSETLFSFLGAIGVAVIAPWKVQLNLLPDWSHLWSFNELSSELLTLCAFLVVAFFVGGVYGIFGKIRRMPEDKGYPLATSMFLLFFAGSFAVCSFRLFTRGPDYLYEATYYISFFVFSLSGLLASLIAILPVQWIRIPVIVVTILVAVFQIRSLTSFLHNSSDARQGTSIILENARSEIKSIRGACFAGTAGFDAATPPVFNRWTPLLHDVSCSQQANALPLYLTFQQGIATLSTLEISGPFDSGTKTVPSVATSGYLLPRFSKQITYGRDFMFTLSKVPAFSLVISGRPGNMQVIQVDHNLLSANQPGRFSSLPVNTSQNDVEYTVTFTEQYLLFLANGLLVSTIPHHGLEIGEEVTINLFPPEGAGSIMLTKSEVALSPLAKRAYFAPVTGNLEK